MTDDTIKQAKRQEALDYHEFPRPGKLEIRATKPMATGRDLSNAYSPGVAEACLEIETNAANAARFTSKGNLVAVISNGTAVLGLGNIGAQASKPVMEGKAVLFKKFAGVDCFDIEINESDPEKLAEIVSKLEPTFGAVNLEDIKAPDCFIVERLCKEKMGIPVFHDDQHGTAIVASAAALNALELSGKKIEDLRVVAVGAGAAGIACLKMLIVMGLRKENITLLDSKGVIHDGRNDLTFEKREFSKETDARTLEDAIVGADLFLGVSGPGVLTKEMVARMAPAPVIFALANPNPEILPEEVRKVSADALIATGRADYPNQVNNVLCFPFIFRGALDVGATEINDAMKLACVEAIAGLARAPISAEVGQAYQGERLTFGSEYLIPKPFDPRLLPTIAHAVAKAAIESGVATRGIDLDAYRASLNAQVFKSHTVMRRVFDAARASERRVVFAEGEDERVLRATRTIREEIGIRPILIGRSEVVDARIEREGLNLRRGEDFEIVDPQDDPRYREYWTSYHRLMKRKGVTPDLARTVLRTNTTAIASLMVQRGEADSLVCGTFGEYNWHLNYVSQILAGDGNLPVGALSLLILDDGPLFLADTHVHKFPSAEEVAQIARAAARHVRRFGVEPNVALISDSEFGNLDSASGRTMRGAIDLLDAAEQTFAYEGEMHVDAALDALHRDRIYPDGRISGRANVLVFSNSETAGVTRNILRSLTKAIEVGPILMGMSNKVHIVTPSISARGLLNVAALAASQVSTYA
ncbi:NADP-dependent malic enzyme (plasmid) [Rhizorhabdus wittichii DC-6]|nr:NADP-dependent malic enzyme [Rhizorhabdus wittichii DC-6]